MQIEMDQINSPRIKMHVNGHRFLAAFRVDHPGYSGETEYAIFEVDGTFYISVASGSEPKTGKLGGDSDADVIADAHRAVDDFHSINHTDWNLRATLITTAT